MANAGARPSEWLPGALALVLAVTAARVALLTVSGAELFVDESQYWFWGQDLGFGYYSKPPLIAWVIRASTELGGSDAAFWVRLPAPLLHGATALILGWIAAARYGRAPALWVTGIYLTLPLATVGSALMSTDTVMFPFLAAAMGIWLAALDRRGAAGLAFAAGAFAGVAFLGKYAALYGPLCAALAAALLPGARPGWRAAGLAALGFGLAAAPNVVWNLLNGGTTLQHTLDNAEWVREPGTRLDLASLLTFFASQFAVFGPVLFATLLWLGLLGGAASAERRLLLLLSLPVVALVSMQALLEEAYANWAAAAYLPGVLAVVPWLLTRRLLWLRLTVALHGAFALALPVALSVGTEWRIGPEDRLVFGRYLGQGAMSREVLALARVHGGPVVVDDRAVIADLFHKARRTDLTIWARQPLGRPGNHYEFAHPMPDGLAGEVLFIARTDDLPPICGAPAPLAVIAYEDGAYRGRPFGAWRLPAACLRR